MPNNDTVVIRFSVCQQQMMFIGMVKVVTDCASPTLTGFMAEFLTLVVWGNKINFPLIDEKKKAVDCDLNEPLRTHTLKYRRLQRVRPKSQLVPLPRRSIN